MLSIDTNILFPAFESTAPSHESARAFLASHQSNQTFVLCELVLVELYLLLRNPAVVERPLSAPAASALCQTLRQNPCWRLVDHAPVMDKVWLRAAEPDFSRRRIIDARLAETLIHHGVTEFATVNQRDFRGFKFHRVWNPLASD